MGGFGIILVIITVILGFFSIREVLMCIIFIVLRFSICQPNINTPSQNNAPFISPTVI
jgi:hypothetical protein